MLILSVLHDDVVCLIPDVRAVAVGSVGGEVGILVGIHALGRDALVRIGLVEGVYECLDVSELDGGVVLEDLDDRTLFQLTGELGHDSVARRAARTLLLLTPAGRKGEHQRQRQ